MFAEEQAFKNIKLKITLLDEKILITDKYAEKLLFIIISVDLKSF